MNKDIIKKNNLNTLNLYNYNNNNISINILYSGLLNKIYFIDNMNLIIFYKHIIRYINYINNWIISIINAINNIILYFIYHINKYRFGYIIIKISFYNILPYQNNFYYFYMEINIIINSNNSFKKKIKNY